MKLKSADFLIFGIFLIVIVVFILLVVRPDHSQKKQLVIESNGEKWIYQLDKDITVEIPGTLGVSVIKIQDGKASFEDSPCKNHLCVFSKSISSAGAWIACMPNGVIIRIEGAASEDGIDAFTN